MFVTVVHDNIGLFNDENRDFTPCYKVHLNHLIDYLFLYVIHLFD